MKKIFFIAALFASVWVSAQDLTILHINDTHSHIEPQRNGSLQGHGGVIEQAAYIDSVRCAEGKGNVLLLHAGDFSQGTSYFKVFNGDIEVEVANAMQFDVFCLGNHEFDNGLDDLARRLKNMNAPVVCANYDFSQTVLADIVKPYVVIRKAGRKIGVIGLLTDLSSLVAPEIAAMLKYQNPAEVAEKYARELKAEGCDLVIALTHIGYENVPDSDIELAENTSSVDIIVGGHTHTTLDGLKKFKNLDGKDVVVVTDGMWGLNIGQLSVSFQKNRLTDLYAELKEQNAFPTDASWFPYPAYKDREGWNAIMGEHIDYVIKAGEKYLDYKWQNVDATSYLAYERTGERTVMEKPLSDNRNVLNSLVMAELAEGKGRFIDQIINGTWHLAHMESWVLSAHLPRQHTGRALPDPDQQIIDLGSAPLGAEMAVEYHFFHEVFDEIDPVISKVIYNAIEKQILKPYLNVDNQMANWWLAYDLKPGAVVNNWNPWCNADVMLAYLLIDKNQDRRHKAIRQSLKSVDKFLAYIKTDGACEEGPAYWGHAAGKLYDYLQIMYDATGGKLSLYQDPQIKAMGEYISRSYVGDQWVVNFADASAKLSMTVPLIYNYGTAIGSSEMCDFAVYNLMDKKNGKFQKPLPTIRKDIFRVLESLKCIVPITERVNQLNAEIEGGASVEDCARKLRSAVPSFTWYPETEFCYIKNASDWFFAAKGGHNNESHNHNDIGTFLLYKGSVPIFADAGVGTYTKKTFSEERYTIWSMLSDWHNLPVINGKTQKNGREYRSADVYVSSKGKTKTFRLDISGAYREGTDCRSWIREYNVSDKLLTITDSYELKQRYAPDVLNFVVQGKVLLPGDSASSGYVVKQGEVVIENQGVAFRVVHAAGLVPSVSVMELDDPRLSNVWGPSLRRVSFTGPETAPVKGKYVFKISEL